MHRKYLVLLIVMALALTQTATVLGQRYLPPINCGDIIEVETTPELPRAEYQVQVSAGTVLNVLAEPIGQTIDVDASLYDSGGTFILGANATMTGQSERLDVVVSSSNPELSVSGTDSYDTGSRDYGGRAYGAFTIYLGCILPDGAPVAPGSGTSGAFSGVGFPGLAAVDFNNGITLPFMLDTPNAGAISPGFDAVFGFTLDARAGDKLDLTSVRSSGNLSLGIAVVTPDNQLIYRSALITAERLNALLTLPVDGQYIIGVWQLDVAAPFTPENTAFQLTGTLNP